MLDKLPRIFDRREISGPNPDWPSIVLLLQKPNSPSADQVLEMAREAWGASGPVQLIGTVGRSFVIRASTLNFAIHAVSDRYNVTPVNVHPSQTRCWDEHKGWMSIDMPNRRVSQLRSEGQLHAAYFSILLFVGKHWNPNYLGLYFPAETALMPNHGDLIESIRIAGRNGIDLRFLRKPS